MLLKWLKHIIVIFQINKHGKPSQASEHKLSRLSILFDSILMSIGEKLFCEKKMMNDMLIILKKFSTIKWMSLRLVAAIVGMYI